MYLLEKKKTSRPLPTNHGNVKQNFNEIQQKASR